MITLEMFSVYDSKTELFVQPFFSPTCASALRSFETSVNDPTTDLNKHHGDYTLFHIATFDQKSGTIAPLQAPANLGLATLLITKD